MLVQKNRRVGAAGPNSPGYLFPLNWQHLARPLQTLPQTTTRHLFQVQGRILVRMLLAQVTTIIQGTDPVLKVTATPTVGTAVDVASTIDTSSLEVGGFVFVEGDGTALVKSNAGASFIGANSGLWICNTGYIDLISGASKTGALKWDLCFQPLDEAAYVAVAGF